MDRWRKTLQLIFHCRKLFFGRSVCHQVSNFRLLYTASIYTIIRYLSQVTYVIPTYSAISRWNFRECWRRLLQIGCAPSTYYHAGSANSLNDGITQLPNTPSNGAGVVASAKRKLRRLERSSGRFHKYMYTWCYSEWPCLLVGHLKSQEQFLNRYAYKYKNMQSSTQST